MKWMAGGGVVAQRCCSGAQAKEWQRRGKDSLLCWEQKESVSTPVVTGGTSLCAYHCHPPKPLPASAFL